MQQHKLESCARQGHVWCSGVSGASLENSKHPLLNVCMVSHQGEDGFYSSHFSFSTEVTHFYCNVVFL